jgi:hypothetical protein
MVDERAIQLSFDHLRGTVVVVQTAIWRTRVAIVSKLVKAENKKGLSKNKLTNLFRYIVFSLPCSLLPCLQ